MDALEEFWILDFTDLGMPFYGALHLDMLAFNLGMLTRLDVGRRSGYNMI